jgi:hypothetical protein
MDFPIDDANLPDDPAKEQAITAACRELGYDLDAPSPPKRPPLR